nr:NAD(P)-dependent alcohol dehydrogenase [uncultured Cohaesibacter sp.]
MCEKCKNGHAHQHEMIDLGRRDLLLGSAGLAAGVALGTAFGATEALAQEADPMAVEAVEAFAFSEPNGMAKAMSITRRAVGPNDVKMDVMFAGICHSDIHTINGDWGRAGPFPLVPGHEIIGRVTAVGSNVTRFKVGDIGGVGCMVDSCGECENCLNDREQNCLNGTTWTYGAEDKVLGGQTFGGYSRKIVVKDHFVVNVPDSLDLSRAAPLMCAGITTYSPMQFWKLEKGQRVGVIGIGGLGHMAVKLGVARGADVTAFTTSDYKIPLIEAMGAKAVLASDVDKMRSMMNSFDLMIAAVPYAFDMQKFINLLKLDATLVNVGQLAQIDGLSGMMMGFGRKSLAGSMIGGMAETQELVNYCASHNIQPDVEIIKPEQISEAISRVIDKDVKFRFVIDMRTA